MAGDDLTGLRELSARAILTALGRRFARRECATFIGGSVLLSVNPMRPVDEPTGLAGTPAAEGVPHPFSVAESAYRQLARESCSQCIVISGESGAGKSETCKRVLHHLVLRSGSLCNVDKQLLAASPILESFGNARTASNANSSRFGKFVSLHFTVPHRGSSPKFSHAAVETYLLERSRVVRHDPGERSFHIFYELLAGATSSLRARLHLDEARAGTGEVLAPYRDDLAHDTDAAQFERLMTSLATFGLDRESHETLAAFELIAAVMHLRAIHFDANDSIEGSVATAKPGSRPALNASAQLLGVTPESLLKVLCERSMTLRGETLTTQRTVEDASQTCAAIAKSLYQSLFAWLVGRINAALCAPRGAAMDTDLESPFLGILDIFGFECFQHNSFEQLLINFANEALQTTFNKHLFDAELRLYRQEGLAVDCALTPPSSTCRDCLELFRRPRGAVASGANGGLLMALDAISVGPQPSDAKLIAHLHRSFASHPCFVAPHPRLVASVFVIQHYAGKVQYAVDGFVAKNLDRLPQDAAEFFADATNAVLLECSPGAQVMSPSRPAGHQPHRRATEGKMRARSIAARFEQQIQCLMGMLEDTKCSFIRCIKPNHALDPAGGFDDQYVNLQLQSLSIPQTAQLLQAGLPGRVLYSELFEGFRVVLPERLRAVPESLVRVVVRTLCEALDLEPLSYKLGRTRAFFKNGALSVVDARLRAIEAGERALPSNLADDIDQAISVHCARRLLLYAGAIFRWKVTRQRLSARRALATTRLQSFARQCLMRRKFLRTRELVVAIQRLQRQKLATAAAIELTHRIAATKLQSFIRGRAAARERCRRSSTVRIQSAWRMALAVREYRRVMYAVILIQRAWISKSLQFTYSSTEDEGDMESECLESPFAAMRNRYASAEAAAGLAPESFTSRREDAQAIRHLSTDGRGSVAEAPFPSLPTVDSWVEAKLHHNQANYLDIRSSEDKDEMYLPGNEITQRSPAPFVEKCKSTPFGKEQFQHLCESEDEDEDEDTLFYNATLVIEQDAEEEDAEQHGHDDEEEDGYCADDDQIPGAFHDAACEEDDDGSDSSHQVEARTKSSYNSYTARRRELLYGTSCDPSAILAAKQRIITASQKFRMTGSKVLVDAAVSPTPPKRKICSAPPKRRESAPKELYSQAPQRRFPVPEAQRSSNEDLTDILLKVSGEPVQPSRRKGALRTLQGSAQVPDAKLAVGQTRSRTIAETGSSSVVIQAESVVAMNDPASPQCHITPNANDARMCELAPPAEKDGHRPASSQCIVSEDTADADATKRSHMCKSRRRMAHSRNERGTDVELLNSSVESAGNELFVIQEAVSAKPGKTSAPWSAFRFPAMFKFTNREQRAVTRNLRAAIKKKHYRQLIEALVKARELNLSGPEVATAERMVFRIKSIHAQQLLREAMVQRDIDALDEAIYNATKFGMEDSKGLLRQAHELCSAMKDKRRQSLESHLSGKKIARKKSALAATAS